ncbi:uncharacterized protein [Haliotis asinina]|uniref:uncharacterized protein n=1 Tax=Haliotis asinina TaxID=109174 RepID=UPI0035327FD3
MKVENVTISDGQNIAKDFMFTTTEDRLKPLLMTMKLFGMYFNPKQDSSTLEYPPNGRKRISTSILAFFGHRMYCYMVLLLMWFNFVRCAVAVPPYNESLPFRILLTFWYLQCALNATIMVVSCQRHSHLRSFYYQWDSLLQNNTSNHIGRGFKCQVKYFMFPTLCGWIAFSMGTAAAFTISVGNLSTSKIFLSEIVKPFPETQWAVALHLILHIFCSAAWIFPVIFVFVVSRIIKAQFHRFGKVLSKQIQEAGDHIPERLPELRSLYMQFCQAVNIINRTFKWILGISFFLQVFLACFTLYQMINGPQGMFLFFANSFWLGSCFLLIILLTRSSSDVHEAAHCLLDDVYKIGTKHATSELLGQLNLFVFKLTGGSTGFTAINFFVVTHEFVLTLGGMFITYFFLLLQFKI